MSSAAKLGRRIAVAVMLMTVAGSLSAAPLLTAAPGALSPPPTMSSGGRAVPNTPADDQAALAAYGGRIKPTFGQVEPLEEEELASEDSAEAAQDGRSVGNDILGLLRSPDPKGRSRQPGGEDLRRLIIARDDPQQNLPASIRGTRKSLTWTDTLSELNRSFQSDGDLLEVFRGSDTLDSMLETYERRILDIASNVEKPGSPKPEFTAVTVYVAPDAKPFFNQVHKFGGLPRGNGASLGGGRSFKSSLPQSGLMSPKRAAAKPKKKKRTTNVIVALGEFVAFVVHEIYSQVWARVLILLAMFAMTVRFFQTLGRRH